MTPEQQTRSYWAEGAPDFSAPPLRDDTTAEICVIGAGIAGLTTATLLAREGRDVVLLEADLPGGEGAQTARTTAHLANAIDDRFYNLIRWHGVEGAQLAASSHAAAINTIEALATELNLDCEFRRLDGYLFPSQGDADHLDEEKRAAEQAGIVDVALFDHLDLPGFQHAGRVLRFPHQAQILPLRYLAGLRDEFLRHGGRLFTQSRVTKIDEGAIAHVITAGGVVRAGAVVVATNTPISDRVTIHTKQAPYRTYAVSFKVPTGRIAPGLYWDDADPYHYVRLARGPDATHQVLIAGGEDHKTGQGPSNANEPFEKLEAWTRAHFPAVGEITHRWSGQVMESIDGLAFIGRDPGHRDNIFVATGDSGMGMTHGTIAGMILTDLIQGRDNPWAALYSPARKTIAAAGTFARETLNMARQYLDWGRPHPKEETAVVARGSGCVVQRGMEKIAIHCTNEGLLHEMSAVCPHLGCVVRWNSTEHTWDCPCHGSRFAADGEVINGPARQRLAPVTPRANVHVDHERHAHD